MENQTQVEELTQELIQITRAAVEDRILNHTSLLRDLYFKVKNLEF